MPKETISKRQIESVKDSRGRITHWHCSACNWTTAVFPRASTAMALSVISDAFDAHDCATHNRAQLVPLREESA